MGDCALITPVYLEIALLSGARSGTQATGQVISAIDIADISIRTLREEGDYPQRSVGGVHRDFYPCPPRGGRPTARNGTPGSRNFYPRPPRGGRPALAAHFSKLMPFLSTPSARRATVYLAYKYRFATISIHALREEGDRSFPIANSHS